MLTNGLILQSEGLIAAESMSQLTDMLIGALGFVALNRCAAAPRAEAGTGWPWHSDPHSDNCHFSISVSPYVDVYCQSITITFGEVRNFDRNNEANWVPLSVFRRLWGGVVIRNHNLSNDVRRFVYRIRSWLPWIADRSSDRRKLHINSFRSDASELIQHWSRVPWP